MKRTAYMGLPLLFVLALALSGLAQSEAENDAYRVFYNENDARKKIELGENFLAEFKESTYRSPVLQSVLALYVQGQNWTKILEHAGKFSIELPNADAKTKATVYTYAMAAAQSTNSVAKTVAYGDEVLAVDPNNLQ